MFILVLVGAISAHISVNTLNEYYDFKSGLDLKTEKTPFSGGSGALPGNPEMDTIVLIAGLISLMVTVIIGIYLVLERGIQILPIGVVGIFLVAAYTQWINRYPLICLIAPGLGFGVLMVVGTHVILAGGYSRLPWLVSLVPFFLVNNLLLLNQYPDRIADASVGRNTFPIVFGLKKSNFVYAVFMTVAYSLILFLVMTRYLPALSIIALAPAVFSIYALLGANKYAAEIACYPRFMRANVAAAISTPWMLGISIIYG